MINDYLKSLINKKTTMSGGSANGNSSGFVGFYVFFFSLFMLVVKSFLVMLSYNLVVPRILMSYNVNMSKYRPITFIEGVLLVILFNNLFSY